MTFEKSYALELAIIFGVFLVINMVFAARQRQITFNGGLGWEGVGYHAMAEQFIANQPLSAEGPYVYRIATPWLAAKVAPNDLVRGCSIVNLCANTVGVFLLWLWLRRHIATPFVRVLLVLLYQIRWDAPTRWIWFYPVHADPWLYVTLFGGLLLIDHYRTNPSRVLWLALCGISIVGVLNREVAMLVPLTLLFVGNPVRAGEWPSLPRLRDCVPLVLSLATFATIKVSVHQTDSYSFVGTVVDFLYAKGIGSYFHGWLLAFGPVLFLLIYDYRRAFAFFRERPGSLRLFPGMCGLWVRRRHRHGTAALLVTARDYLLLGRAIEQHRSALSWSPLLVVLALAQIISVRLPFTTPDYNPAQPVPATRFRFSLPLGATCRSLTSSRTMAFG